MGYERFALILDSQSAELGRAAMRLLDLGIDVLYANDPDEAALLARQESRRLGAVLVPSTYDPSRLPSVLAGVCSQLAAGPRGLVAVGLEPEPDFSAALADQGAEWCLWEPYDERELRFVMTAAMATAHEGNRRKHLRVPTRIETTAFMGRHRKDVVVHDLSQTGAYMATPRPFLEGSPLSIEIPLPGGSVVGKAQVMSAKTPDQPIRADVPAGMGIEFTKLVGDSSEVLRAFLADRVRRFRLRPDEAP